MSNVRFPYQPLTSPEYSMAFPRDPRAPEWFSVSCPPSSQGQLCLGSLAGVGRRTVSKGPGREEGAPERSLQRLKSIAWRSLWKNSLDEIRVRSTQVPTRHGAKLRLNIPDLMLSPNGPLQKTLSLEFCVTRGNLGTDNLSVFPSPWTLFCGRHWIWTPSTSKAHAFPGT